VANAAVPCRAGGLALGVALSCRRADEGKPVGVALGEGAMAKCRAEREKGDADRYDIKESLGQVKKTIDEVLHKTDEENLVLGASTDATKARNMV